MVAARVEPSEYQKSVLEKLSASAGAGGEERKVVSKQGGKRRPKGPNPLSVKKSTKMRSRAGVGSLRGVSSKNKVCYPCVFLHVDFPS
jgi:hypothetical protein